MLVSSACRPFWGGDDRPGSAWTSGYIWWVVAKTGHRELLAHYKRELTKLGPKIVTRPDVSSSVTDVTQIVGIFQGVFE